MVQPEIRLEADEMSLGQIREEVATATRANQLAVEKSGRHWEKYAAENSKRATGLRTIAAQRKVALRQNNNII